MAMVMVILAHLGTVGSAYRRLWVARYAQEHLAVGPHGRTRGELRSTQCRTTEPKRRTL